MSDRDEDKCMECDAPLTLQEEKRAGICWTCSSEEDFLAGFTCNPDAPEECESCQ